MVTIGIEIFEFEKIFKMANSPVKNVVLRKAAVQIGQKCEEFHSPWGQHDCLNKGVKFRGITVTKFSSTQPLLNDTKFQNRFLNLMGKRLANRSSKTASKLTSWKLRNNPELVSHLRVQFLKTFFPA